MREIITTALEVAGLVALSTAAALGAMQDAWWAGCTAGGASLLASSFVIQLVTRGGQ